MIFNPVEIRTLIHVATRRTGSPVHDEDLEQDVALHALEAFRRLRDITHPRALLMKIVKDAVRDHWRRKRSAEELAYVQERFICYIPAFESHLDRAKKLDLLRRGLDELPFAKRQLLELFYIDDHSVSEIATLQGRSISAVKMELARSRRALAQIVRRLADKKPRKARKIRTSSS